MNNPESAIDRYHFFRQAKEKWGDISLFIGGLSISAMYLGVESDTPPVTFTGMVGAVCTVVTLLNWNDAEAERLLAMNQMERELDEDIHVLFGLDS